MSTRTIALAGLITAAYTVLTLTLAPISYGPVQLRISTLLNPLVLIGPGPIIGLVLGTAIANLTSPYGPLDLIAMPIVSALAGIIAWKSRRWPIPATITQSLILSAAVTYFPLHLGAHLPLWPTFLWVLLPNLLLPLIGYQTLYKTLTRLKGL